MSHSQPSNSQYYPASDMHKKRKNDDQKQPPPPLTLARHQGKMFDLHVVHQQAATKNRAMIIITLYLAKNFQSTKLRSVKPKDHV